MLDDESRHAFDCLSWSAYEIDTPSNAHQWAGMLSLHHANFKSKMAILFSLLYLN
ncbi:hypothetical protein OK016_29715 [Vibrio chagasii]|nr:hypothetical protein [Vibrio chagasii]